MTARRIALVLPAAVALAWPAAALAHANLIRTSPADRSVLAAAPRAATFVFDDRVRALPGIRAVRNGGESILAGRARVVGGKTLLVPLRHLGAGDYTVLWRILSDDGHTEAGVIAFAVGRGRSPPEPALAATSGPRARDVVSRWLLLAGILVAGGGAAYRLATGTGRATLLLPAFVAVFLGASALLPHHATLTTRFGLAYAVATLLAAFGALATVLVLVDARASAAVWALGLALLPIPSVAGHALDPGQGSIEVLVDLLHLTAAAVWTGGLVQLAFALSSRTDRVDVARRFSTVALVAVLVLGASGVTRAIAELRSVSQLWTTGYGRLLIVKTALLVLLAAFGWLNRTRLLPRGDVTGLRRSVTVELVLLAGLIVAVAILTDARPGRGHVAVAATAATTRRLGPPPLPAADAVVAAREDGDLAIALAAEPHRIRLTALGPDGLGADALRVTIQGVPTRPCGPGCYERDTSPHAFIPVTVDGRRFTFRVPVHAAPAHTLVARSTRAFLALRSVTYVERLASSPQQKIVSTFTLEAPDRLEYHIHGGASAVVIGTHRWDGCDRSVTTKLPQPSPIWGRKVTNARLLRRTATHEVVSFLNPTIPAWFTVRLDRRTELPQQLEMTATAHFMHHRYSAFNAPRRIFPPRC